MAECRKCGDWANPAAERGAYLKRVNEFGVKGIWECSPTCGENMNQRPGDPLLMALEENETQGTD